MTESIIGPRSSSTPRRRCAGPRASARATSRCARNGARWAWQRATASASASSSRIAPTTGRSRRTMNSTCCLAAAPCRETAIFTSVAVYSWIAAPRCRAASRITPRTCPIWSAAWGSCGRTPAPRPRRRGGPVQEREEAVVDGGESVGEGQRGLWGEYAGAFVEDPASVEAHEAEAGEAASGVDAENERSARRPPSRARHARAPDHRATAGSWRGLRP